MNTLFSSNTFFHVTVAILPFLLGMILHEIAHGWMALRCGDPTAKFLGRLTLNPIRHLDIQGGLVFLLTAIFTPFVIGWAKPVPINPNNFHSWKRDTIYVCLAGPLTNFILALFFTFLLRLLLFLPEQFLLKNLFGIYLFNMVQAGILINITLGWFNLIPILPLDGGRILSALLPDSVSIFMEKYEKFGFLILIILLASNLLNYIVTPLLQYSWSFLLFLIGIT